MIIQFMTNYRPRTDQAISLGDGEDIFEIKVDKVEEVTHPDGFRFRCTARVRPGEQWLAERYVKSHPYCNIVHR